MNTLPRISDWMDERKTTLVPRLTSKIQAVAFFTACARGSLVFMLAQVLAQYVYNPAAVSGDSESLWWWQRVCGAVVLHLFAVWAGLFLCSGHAPSKPQKSQRNLYPFGYAQLRGCSLSAHVGGAWCMARVSPIFVEKVAADTNECPTCEWLERLPYLAMACPAIAAQTDVYSNPNTPNLEAHVLNLLKLRHVPSVFVQSDGINKELSNFDLPVSPEHFSRLWL